MAKAADAAAETTESHQRISPMAKMGSVKPADGKTVRIGSAVKLITTI